MAEYKDPLEGFTQEMMIEMIAREVVYQKCKECSVNYKKYYLRDENTLGYSQKCFDCKKKAGGQASTPTFDVNDIEGF